jgi:Domain of unknown function (DUF4270)
MTIIHNYLRKELLFLFLSITALFLLASCQKQGSLNFGGTYVPDNGQTNIIVVDSSTINMSTVYTDSTATAATGYLMVGSYHDAFLGQMSSTGYIQLQPPATLPTLNYLIDTYDSIGMVMIFKTNNPYYGDTTITQTYQVQEIDTLFQLAPFQPGWFSNRSLPLGPVIGQGPVLITPTQRTTTENIDTVRIPMDNSLGQTLYNLVYNKSDTMTTLKNFQDYFPGLAISEQANSQGIIYGFRDSAIMRIYYQENSAGGVSTTKYIDFTLNNKSFQFNSLTADWTGSPIANLKKPTTISQPPPLTSSTQTGHASYVETMGGLNVKLTFPYLNAIAQRPDYIGLLRAELTVIPLAGSFTTTYTLPAQVGVYNTTLNNLIGAPVLAVGSSTPQTGGLSLNYFLPLQTSYTYDITNFVASQIVNSAPGADSNGIILSIPAPTGEATFKRLVIADQTYPANQRIILSVYYISLYPHQ